MKFFTKEMWQGLQDHSKAAHWEVIWRNEERKYRDHLAKLNLPSKHFKIFNDNHFHGDDILAISVKNNGKSRFQKETGEYSFRAEQKGTEISITTFCPKGYVNQLRYFQVSKFRMDYPSSQPLYFEAKEKLGSWGYDELTKVGESTYRHEILLHSGTEILLEFDKFKFTQRNYKKKFGNFFKKMDY